MGELLIASEAKQSILILDCFVASLLAMTANNQPFIFNDENSS
jgi:hypothetical protein